MTNHGGRADEPTSYSLQPPAPAPRTDPYAAQVPPQGTPHPPTRPAGTAPPAPAAAPVPESGAGRVVGGRYRLVARLGHGGMGTVWRAHDEVVDREVAVKEPRVPDHVDDRERANVHLRMQREARAAARIDHPAVVTVHDVVVEDGRPWIVMELVRGQSLADRLQEGTLDVREAARVGLAVLGALDAAHGAGVLHRDVKPDNVLLGRGDRVVLTDFGIAQVEGEQGLTETGSFVGSPEFIAPERVLGQRPGPESDLWSLGVVLYAAVEGMSPYRRSNTPATLQAVLSAEPQTPARGSGAFGTLVMQLLRKDPSARPGAAEVRAVLEAVARPPRRTAVAGPYTGAAGSDAASAWVPPALRGNRKAAYGLLVGVLAAALALVLIVADPFAGDELPADWIVRPENEVVSAEVAVPKEYRRVEGDDASSVAYHDPSGVFGIHLERVDLAEDEDALAPDPAKWAAHYDAGGKYGTEIKAADTETRSVQHQGRNASEVIVDFTPPGASGDDPVRHRWHERYIVKDKNVYWRLRVSMPAEGRAARDGEALYDQVVQRLRFQGL
ncbi:serine/threonine-protein kinase [Streptomyces sp. NPDC050856]|uniref:serine/threonine-protein kinase n=1 Tax=Streptomyces sp. NPDC050856 TaxID=3154939 RepID=UPI0033CE606F